MNDNLIVALLIVSGVILGWSVTMFAASLAMTRTARKFVKENM